MERSLLLAAHVAVPGSLAVTDTTQLLQLLQDQVPTCIFRCCLKKAHNKTICTTYYHSHMYDFIHGYYYYLFFIIYLIIFSNDKMWKHSDD